MLEKIVQAIVDKSHFTLLLLAIAIFYGYTSVSSLRVAQEPEVKAAKLWIELVLQGASAVEMEKNVIFPIEEELKSLHDVISLRSKIDAQLAYIDIEFEFGVDMNEKVREIESRINNIKRTLPRDLFFYINKFVFSDVVTAFMMSVRDLEQDASPDKSEKLTLDLIDALQSINALKNIKMLKADENIVVVLDVEKINWYGISIDRITSALVAQNNFSPQGIYEVGEKSIQISGFESQLKTTEDIGETIVYSSANNPIKLSSIARIEKRAQQNPIITRFNQQQTHFIKMSVDPHVNIITVREQIRQVVTAFKADREQSLAIEMIFDQSEGVWNILYNLMNSLLQGMGILMMVLLFSVGYRSMFTISLIIPLSFVFTIIGLSLTGYGVQQVSIAGFIIAMGLIVDNGIVVSENAFILYQYKNHSHRKAAIVGTSTAISPLISSTLTTMLAFAPLFLLYSDEGLYLRSLTISIWFALGASLFIAVTLIAIILAKIGTPRQVPYLPTPPSFLISLMPFRDKIYVSIARFFIRFRILTLILFLLGFFYAVYVALGLNIQLFPPVGNPYFTVNMNVPASTSLADKQWLAKEVEKRIQKHKEIEAITTLIGAEFPRIDATINYKGDIIVLVKTESGKESHLKATMAKVKQDLYALQSFTDFSLSLFQLQDLDYQSDFTLQLSSHDTDALKIFAKQVDAAIRSIEGIDNIINPMKSQQLRLDISFLPRHAQQLGVAKADVDALIAMLSYGREIDRFRDNTGKEFPLLLKIDIDPNNPMDVFRKINVKSRAGDIVPLSEVIDVRFVPGETRILHHQYKPLIEIDCYIDTNSEVNEVAQRLLKAIQQQAEQAYVEVELGGALKSSQQTVSGFGFNVAIIAALIFSIFVIQFRSFRQPFIIFTAVPMCVIGAILAVNFADLPLSFFAAVGITSLMGIVVNDSILLVDEANRIAMEEEQKTLHEIAVEAGRKRFMPVVLTSVTTIAGLLPLAMSESMFKGMAVSIIGGLISSTLLILLLVPALYTLFSRKNDATA